MNTYITSPFQGRQSWGNGTVATWLHEGQAEYFGLLLKEDFQWKSFSLDAGKIVGSNISQQWKTDYKYLNIQKNRYLYILINWPIKILILLLPAILLGIFFIGLFNLMGYTAQKVGLTAVSVANKLSLVIPVVAAFIFFNEQITILKITAIALAIIAVVMVTYQKNDTQHRISIWHFILPIILFIGSGFNDSVVNYVQKKMLPAEESGLFVIWIFQIAAIIGSILLIVLFLLKKKIWQWRNILAGICLGVPNYFSMFYLIKALSNSGWQSSIVFPINNVSIVICSAITGIIFFKEKISTLQLTGILIAC